MNLLMPLLLAAALLAPASHTQAETRSFRCKNDLVNLGDGKAATLLICGEPLVKDSYCKPQASTTTVQPALPVTVPAPNVTVVTNAVCETVDEWTYNPGRGQFMTTLRFESGKLVAITYGNRVP
jgi:hypothetical protein